MLLLYVQILYLFAIVKAWRRGWRWRVFLPGLTVAFAAMLIGATIRLIGITPDYIFIAIILWLLGFLATGVMAFFAPGDLPHLPRWRVMVSRTFWYALMPIPLASIACLGILASGASSEMAGFTLFILCILGVVLTVVLALDAFHLKPKLLDDDKTADGDR